MQMLTSQAQVSILYVVALAIVFAAIFLGCTSGNKARSTGKNPLWVIITAVIVLTLIYFRLQEFGKHFATAMHMLFR